MNDTNIFQQLQDSRLTKQRKAVYSIFKYAHKPLDIGQIIKRLEEKLTNVHRATVYRIIKFLVKQKIISELNLGKSGKKYELKNKPHHHHFMCEQCSRIINVYPATIEKAINRFELNFAKEYKHQISRHSLKFFGICHSCQNKKIIH